MSKRAHLSLAVALAGAAVGVTFLPRGLGDRRAVGGELAVADLEKRIGAAHAALVERTAELSAMPRLASALATDAATVRDLVGQELALRPQAGESIVLAQRLRDRRVVPLLIIPSGAELPTGQAGESIRIEDGQLTLSRTVDVAPSERADEITGVLAVRHALDPRSMAEALPASITGARLAIGDASLSLRGALSSSMPTVTKRLSLPDRSQVTLVLAAKVQAWPLRALAALLGLSAVALVLLSLRAKRADLIELPTTQAPEAETGRTMDSSVVFAGTLAAPSQPSTGPPARTPTVTGSLALAGPAAVVAQDAGQERIGRYAIVRRLGQGGMADVFLARAEGEAGFGKLVALKVMQPTFAAYPVAVELFLDEARLVAGLDHPNIVQTYDLGRAGERFFIAMEYVDGIDLARLVELLQKRGERMPVPYVLAILCRICDGLHAAHSATGPDGQPLHLVHRDVKSANVFLSRTGAVKVGDFGIAKASHRVRMSRTAMGEVKGTPGYMSPEQRLGLEVDPRADVYGVGCIAYEALSGQTVNLDYVALAARGTEGWPHLPPLASFRADVPGDLDAIVFMALAYARENRFADCVALERALREVGATTGIAHDKDIGMWVRTQLDRPAVRERTWILKE